MTKVNLSHVRGWLVAASIVCVVVLFAGPLSAQSTPKSMQKPMSKSMQMPMSKSMSKSMSMVKGTEPPDGAELKSAPKNIGISFMMPMQVTVLKLSTMAGETIPVDLGQPKMADKFAVSVSALDPDQYSVEWQARGQDGHTMSGSFGFTVSEAN